MDKIKKTIHGIINMPSAAATALSRCVLICCLIATTAILLTVAAQSGTYEPFEFLAKADILMRFAPTVLIYGVIKSLSCAVQYKK